MPFSGPLRRSVRLLVLMTSAALVASAAEVVAAAPADAAPAPRAAGPAVADRPDRVSALAAARAQGSRVKIDGEGSPRSEIWVNPDGSSTVEAYQQPAFRRDGAKRDGQNWVPLTTDVTGTGTAADPFTADGLPRKVTLGRSAAGLMSIDVPGGQVTFSGAGLDLGSATRSGSTVTYADAAAATDLRLQVTPTGISTDLVLKSLLAPTSFRFHLADPDGLVGTPAQQPDGSYLFSKDLGDGWQLGLAAPSAFVPSLLDGLGAGVVPDTATQVVTRAGDGWDITLAVDPTWLVGKVFPIVLDPSPVFVANGPGTPGVDCIIASGASATTNYCPAATRDVGLNMSKIRRTIAMFGLTSIPTNASVSAADLDLYLESTEAATAAIPVKAYRMTQGWNQGATWNTTNGTSAWTTAGGTHDTSTVLATTTVGLTAGHYHWAVSPAAVQNWISGAAPNYGLILRASSETTVGVLRFASGFATDPTQRPRLTVTYNTPPGRPAGRTVQPCSAQCGSPVLTSSTTPTLTGQAADPDGVPLRYDFEVYAGSAATPTTLVTSGSVSGVTPGTKASWRVPASTLTAGSTYEYRVRVWDGLVYSAWSSGWVVFTPDTTAPTVPTVSSTAFPENAWNTPDNGSISYTSTDAGGIAGYQTKLDNEQWSATDAATSRSFTGLEAGWHTLSVRAQDKAGNLSTARSWSWGVNVGGIDSPQAEDRTAARITLAASALASMTYLKWQYRLGTTGSFTDVPLGDLTTPGTSTHPAAWPVARSGGSLPVYTWDIASTAGLDGPVQVQVCFSATANPNLMSCVTTRTIQLARTGTGGSYATTTAGPGTVSLLTGDMSVSESDVDVPSYNGSLSLGRTLTTLSPTTVTTGATGIFGPAWTASHPGPDAGAADQRVDDHTAAGYITLVSDDGTQDIYAQTATAGTTTTYTAIGDAGADGATLVKDTGPTPNTLTLSDLDGTSTVWSSITATTWGITKVTEPGSSTTSYTRDGAGRVTQILAPVPAGVNCTTPLTTAGCRTLTLTYASTTTATGTTPSTWGDYTGRLASVAFTAYKPGTGMTTTPVASYAYDSTGLLRAQWDPRISPALKTTYDYGTGNRLTAITSPGLSGWSVNYDGTNRVTAVTRPNPGGGTQTTTIRYDVPFTGASAPIELGKTTTDTWAQTDVPAVAAAAWGPDRVPAATPSTADWQYADLSYLDVNGRAVNTASYGNSAWQIDTTEYDKHGNTIRTLDAGNRNDALTPTANPDLDPYVASIGDSPTRAALLSDTTVYSSDGVDELASYGPMHPVILEDGTTGSAREHSSTTYDQGAPAGTEPHLPTTEVTAAQTPDGADHDARTTLTGYDPILTGDPSGWDLRQATSTTTKMASPTPDIVKKTRYNAAGQEIESRMPSEPGGGGPGTALTTYYTAGGTGTCGAKPYWAGLTCQTTPAAQPAGGPNLATTTITYTQWDAPDTATEVVGATTRTTTSSYDGAARPTGQTLTVTPAADGGAAVPAVTTGYDPATGLPTTTSSSAGAITIGYDAIGQPTSYTQTSGGVTISAGTKTYDIAGRVATESDGKGTTTFGYDSTADHRGNTLSAADTLAGTTTAAYDADGTATTLTYPGGLTATTGTDNDGNPVRLTYTKSGTTWLSFTQTESVHGQVRDTSSPATEQVYSYDPAARLTRTDDLTGSTCTRRDYAFDANTNRTGLTTTPGAPLASTPGILCDLTGGTPATVSSTYDGADRATATGYTYDNLGRTTSAPAAAVTGGAALTVGYSANDMVNTLTQAGRTKTYTLDPADRVLTIADTAGLTLTDHYTEPGDNPAWIGASDGTWTRYTDTPAGGLGLTVDSGGDTSIDLSNLHGDIIGSAGTADSTLSGYSETTEYGLARDSSIPTPRYGWLGGAHRDTGDALAQLTLMGARLYNPTTGRFLSTDPVPGGSCNDYDYACADPVNGQDLDGNRCFSRKCIKHWVSHHKLDIAMTVVSFIPVAQEAAWAYRGYRAYRVYRTYRQVRAVRYASRACRVNSFVASTGVLMADGTIKAIADITPGDVVQAGDADSEDTAAETVTDVIVGEGDKDLVTISADSDGDGITNSVAATGGHPFFSDGTWRAASDLQVGD